MVSKIETGAYAGAPAMLEAIRRTLEYAGVAFTNGDAPGVKLRKRWLTRGANFHVDVLEDEIIITLPFTNYTVTYYKPTTSPGLLAKNFSRETSDDQQRARVTNRGRLLLTLT
jgi:hypothetical protein